MNMSRVSEVDPCFLHDEFYITDATGEKKKKKEKECQEEGGAG